MIIRIRTGGCLSLLLLLLLLFPASMLLCATAYAGNLNGNEQSIAAVIGGRFEKDGVVYKVRQEYIDSAIRYMQRDDVDLTAQQAQSAISEIYANVQTGIESGYLEAVEKTAPAEQISEEASEEKADPKPTARTGTEGTREETTAPEPAPSRIISILELIDKVPPQSYEYLSGDTDALMARIHIPYRAVLYIIFLMAAITAVITAVSCVMKPLARRRHRKLRMRLRYILAAETGVLSAICLVIAAAWIGVFQDSAVLNKLSETRYYHTIFEELKRDTLMSFALLDIPDNVMDNAITYERVVTAARQQVESDLSQGTYRADTSILTDALKDDIGTYLKGESITMTDQAKVGLNELLSRLEQKYSSLLRWPFAAWWVKMKAEFFSFVKIALPLSLLLVIVSQTLIIFLNHYRRHGVVLCGRCLMAGGLITMAAFCIGLAAVCERMPKVAPEYMELFFRIAANRLCRTGIVTGSMGIVLGLICLLAVRSRKDEKR